MRYCLTLHLCFSSSSADCFKLIVLLFVPHAVRPILSICKNPPIYYVCLNMLMAKPTYSFPGINLCIKYARCPRNLQAGRGGAFLSAGLLWCGRFSSLPGALLPVLHIPSLERRLCCSRRRAGHRLRRRWGVRPVPSLALRPGAQPPSRLVKYGTNSLVGV